MQGRLNYLECAVAGWLRADGVDGWSSRSAAGITPDWPAPTISMRNGYFGNQCGDTVPGFCESWTNVCGVGPAFTQLWDHISAWNASSQCLHGYRVYDHPMQSTFHGLLTCCFVCTVTGIYSTKDNAYTALEKYGSTTRIRYLLMTVSLCRPMRH